MVLTALPGGAAFLSRKMVTSAVTGMKRSPARRRGLPAWELQWDDGLMTSAERGGDDACYRWRKLGQLGEVVLGEDDLVSVA